MKNIDIMSLLPGALLPWYERNKRELPWRVDRDPYHVWVSEIMLQQTRVEAVKGYYTRFLELLPSVNDLAVAEDAILQKLWEGLGYYNRIRNMKKAAVVIMEKFGGIFPTSYSDILDLPGIGEYTAGAICSIAYDQPTPAVDGNVLRVLARLTDDHRPVDTPEFKKYAQVALAQIYPERSGDFTQALMELGATVCGPNRRPNCPACPCNSFCLGHKHNTAEILPIKEPKRQRRIEERTVFILSCDGEYALQKRPPRGLLADLWQFPNVVEKLDVPDAIKQVVVYSLKPKEILRTVERKHIFTHVEWQMRGIYMEVAEKNSEFVWMSTQQIEKEAALPSAFRQFWEDTKNI